MKANLAVKNTSEYKATSTEETLGLLGTSVDGLTDSEIQRRVQLFGFNEVAEKRKPGARFPFALLGYHAMAPGTSYFTFDCPP